MKVIKSKINEITYFQTTAGEHIVEFMAKAARVCYKSENRASRDNDLALIDHLIERGHEAMIEFWMIGVHLTVDRGVTHELVRHRLASFAQESTRYCDYNNAKFNGEITVIEPPNMTTEQAFLWVQSMECAEGAYRRMREAGAPAEIARGVLPTSLKSEIWMMANVREWRHIMALRTKRTAHPLMRFIMRQVAAEFARNIPILFDEWKDAHKSEAFTFEICDGKDGAQ